jgi:tRNA G37 N-methylase Trm5/tRNA(Phe) wybutosine-synthesizing methylase Tyw3
MSVGAQSSSSHDVIATLNVANFDTLKATTVAQIRDNVGDRSRAGRVDADVVPLVDTINALRDFYTTSSCAGRLILVQSAPGDRARTYDVDWLAVTHDCAVSAEVHSETFWQALCSQSTSAIGVEVAFKMEAPIVTVCARDIHCAAALAHVCRIAGVKRSAVTSLHDKIIVSVADTRKIEMLVALDGRVLVDRAYFDTALRHALAKLIAARQRLLHRFRRECGRRLPCMPGATLPAIADDNGDDDDNDDDGREREIDERAAEQRTTASSATSSDDALFVLQLPLCAATDPARRALQQVEFTHPELSCVKDGSHFFVPLSGAAAAANAVAHLRLHCAALFEADDDEVVLVHRVPASSVSHTEQQCTVSEPRALSFRARRAQTQTVRELVIARLSRTWTAAVLIDWSSLVPHKWEKLGSVVVLREWPTVDALRRASARPLSTSLCAAALNALTEALMHHMRVTAVCFDSVGIGGELRRPDVRVVAVLGSPLLITGDDNDTDVRVSDIADAHLPNSPTLTTHVENGVLYHFDVRLCMFASGNGTERMHFATVRAPGERVVDMFAGIGYFALPLAIHGGVERVVCLEKNSDSAAFLRHNAVLNNVAARLEVICGDNREVGNEYIGTCDRVSMGYLPTPFDFVPRALAFLKPTGGTVHFHYCCRENDDSRFSLPRDTFAKSGYEFTIAQVRFVKHYAPNIDHFVADVVIGKRTN